MSQVSELDTAPETIEATLNYISNNGEKIFTETASPGGVDVRTGGTPDPHRMTIRNGRRDQGLRARPRRLPLRAPRHQGRATSSTRPRCAAVYYAEMEALVKAESGAKRVVVFDHTLRTADDELREKQEDPRGGAPRAQRLHRMVGAAARARHPAATRPTICLRRRFAIIQVWRPIRHPVETFPLAICDARSLAVDDMVIAERRYPNRVGQTYAITYNPAHRWYWFPRMRRDEALVFKVFEFAEGRPRALDRAHRLRGSDLAAARAAAREHRDPHAGVFLTSRIRMHDTPDQVHWHEPKAGENAGLGTFKRPPMPYDRFMEAEGVPVYRGIGVRRVQDLPLAPWKRLGGRGSYIQLYGTEGLWGCYVVEIPAAGALNVERHLYEKVVLVVEGRGTHRSVAGRPEQAPRLRVAEGLAVHHPAQRAPSHRSTPPVRRRCCCAAPRRRT